MNNSKFFMAASAVAITAATVAAPVQASSVHSFTDVGSRYDEAVSFLYEYEVIKGVTPTTFGVHNTLTRGDAAVILAKMLALDTERTAFAGFTDVNSRILGSVNALAEAGIISGVTKTEFRPNDPLTRGAMSKLLVRAFGLEGYEEETPFTDASGVFGPYIEALYGTGITSGKTATTYGTNLNITRGDFANLLYNTAMFVIDEFYFPYAEGAIVTSATTTEIQLAEAVPADYSAIETGSWFMFSVRLEDGTEFSMEPTSYRLSEDRLTLFIEHNETDLTGKAGVIRISDYETVIEASFDLN